MSGTLEDPIVATVEGATDVDSARRRGEARRGEGPPIRICLACAAAKFPDKPWGWGLGTLRIDPIVAKTPGREGRKVDQGLPPPRTAEAEGWSGKHS